MAETAGFPPDEAAEVIRTTSRALRTGWAEIRESRLFPDLVCHIDDRLARHPLTGGTRAG